MYNKPNLFFDVDNTMFDSNHLMLEALNELFGIKAVISDFYNNPTLSVILERYKPELCLEFSHDEISKRFSEYFLDSHEKHEAIEPFPDMPEVITKLSKRYNIWVNTARPHSSLPVLRSLFQKYTPGCVTGIHCVWHYLNGKYHKKLSKREFIIKGVRGTNRAFFDDCPDHIRDIQDIIPSYLFDPTGIYDAEPGIHNRVRSWKEKEELSILI